jgi:hypothetical protein
MRGNSVEKRRIAIDNMIEEIADVEIMVEQVKYLLQIPEEEIQAMKLYKINRIKEVIQEGKRCERN